MLGRGSRLVLEAVTRDQGGEYYCEVDIVDIIDICRYTSPLVTPPPTLQKSSTFSCQLQAPRLASNKRLGWQVYLKGWEHDY